MTALQSVLALIVSVSGIGWMLRARHWRKVAREALAESAAKTAVIKAWQVRALRAEGRRP